MHYFTPMNLFIFELANVALRKKKLKAFVYAEADGSKGGRNVCFCIITYIGRFIGTLLGIELNIIVD